MASRRSFWSSLPLLLLLLLAPLLALALENNFDSYPADAQDCLYKAANATDCTGDTGAELNSCLCTNTGGFVINTAKCIGDKGGVDIDLVYSDLDTACDGTSTPLSISKARFKKAAAEGEATTTSTTDAASTTAASSTESESAHVTTTSGGKTITVVPTQTDDGGGDGDEKGGGGLGTPATIGIGVGAAAIGAAIVGAIFLLRRRRRGGEEAHPMLSNPAYQGGGHPGQDYNENKPMWAAGGYSPNTGWNMPTGYAGAAGVPQQGQQGVVPGPGHVFEMDGSGGVAPGHGAVEMPGSELHGGQQHQGGWNR
ncbi:hypothetical protein AK830_g5157 [Neonectria ditissima]|uniref:Extracellular membrane protein CFEM domain-containing protein n=1 Tax=Neonectria ditissima TaxID=78410 RepID=A0A0P7AU30_9HYPO|nr:hypothetical protein AK830_g5157 [Neonectria ditissima]